MLYWLITNTELGFLKGLLNVFRYITFRTGGAMVTGALFVFLFGPWIIDHLRLRQGKGQPIRTDGPQSHLIAKKGTPTMGGLMILSGLVVSTLLWANPVNPYVWIVLAVTLGFGFVGFYDDYLKVTKQSHSGFAGKLRLSVEDNGLGVPPASRHLLFKMFKRLHPNRSFGSGLGLYILRKSAESLGGAAHYEARDKGSRFIIELPDGDHHENHLDPGRR